MHFRIGTRGSQLALWQANFVAQQLQAHAHSTELVIIETKGDKVLDVALSKIGSKGLFTQELEEQLRLGHIDLAVHSAKDLSSELPDDLEIIAFTAREPVHDVLLSYNPDFSLAKQGGVVGTSSTRRRAQLQRYYPHVQVVDARGNLQTRIKKLQEGKSEALILAYAGVHRMQYHDLIVAHLPLTQFTPAVGQGSIAIQTARQLEDSKKKALEHLLNHAPTAACLLAERSFLQTLQGGCSVPVFGYACWAEAETHLQLQGGIIALDGQEQLAGQITGTDPVQMGQQLGQSILEKGGKTLLQRIRQELT